MGNVQQYDDYWLTNHLNNLIVKTKSNIPTVSPKLVSRERLIQRINDAMNYKLLLVCAPASYGKSTLLIQWASTQTKPVSWLLLDEGDNNEIQFWMYFIQSLYRIQSINRKKLIEMALSDSPPFKKLLTILINELSNDKKTQTIIIDNYHVISNQSIHDHLNYLLTYLPSNIHVCISTRVAPNIPLPSMRAKGELCEILSEDLRFTLDEEEEFIKVVAGMHLKREELLKVDQRMEGWVGGLTMMTLSKKNNDKRLFLKESKNSHCFIKDFMMDEIMKNQSADMMEFLLKSSILTSFNASLCEAVTGEYNKGQSYLEKLEQNNLFLFPLDDLRSLYRFHPMFRECLLGNLKQSYSKEYVTLLHRKASNWYLDNGNTKEAIAHLIKGEEYIEAATLIEEYGSRLYKLGDVNTLRSWLNNIPSELIKASPKLCVFDIKRLIFEGRIDQAKATLLSMDEKLRNNEDCISEFLMLEAIISFLCGEKEAISHYNNACINFKENAKKSYSFIAFNNHYASILQSDFGIKGNINKAVQCYKDLFKVMDGSDIAEAPFAYVNVLLAEAFYEMGEFDKAFHYVKIISQNCHHRSDLGLIVPLQLVNMKLKLTEGNIHAALEIMNKLENLAIETGCDQWLSIIRAHKVRISVEMNTITEVEAWVKTCGISSGSNVYSNTTNEFLSYVRVLMFQDKNDEALVILDKMLPTVEQECGIGTLIHVYNLKAICLHNKNKVVHAFTIIQKSLVLGLEAGYYRIFLDEGRMEHLLHQFTKWNEFKSDSKKGLIQYVEKLLDGFHKVNQEGSSSASNKIKLLTKRELEVLKQLCAGCSNLEISEILFISVITVKVHLKHIYRKLGVKNRSQAIIYSNEIQ